MSSDDVCFSSKFTRKLIIKERKEKKSNFSHSFDRTGGRILKHAVIYIVSFANST